MARKAIQAAGGIVTRGGARPRIAVVQRSKDDAWVLPRGKLERDENPAAGARREVVEETGHRVLKVYEFLGAITYRARGRPKVVQFWRMKADERPSHDIMSDITAVEWLPLAAAVRRLSYPLEKLFLRHVGRRILKRRRKRARSVGRHHNKRRKRARAPKATHRTANAARHARRKTSRAKSKKTKKTKHRTTSRGATRRAHPVKSRRRKHRISERHYSAPVATAHHSLATSTPIAAAQVQRPAVPRRSNILRRMLKRLAP